MLIGVDCGCLGVKDERLKVGVFRLVEDLLVTLGKLDKKNTYYLYSFYPIDKSLLKFFGSRMKNIVVRPTRGWLKIWLPLRISRDNTDVFLGFGQSIPRYLSFEKKPYTISFFYDLAFEKFPKMYNDDLSKLKRNSREAAAKSDVILTISESSKKDISKIYGVKKLKIMVSYPGLHKDFKQSGKKYKNKNPYFLFVGSLKKGKNVPNIIKGFLLFLEKTGKDFDLIIVGGDKWFDEQIEKNNSNIKFLGNSSDEKIRSLYEGAVAFVSPSFYEGFGFPMLEAMALGCPVISSNISSIPEVVGDAGILVNPNNYKEIGNALIEVSGNSRKRKSMIKKGLERSKQFSNIKFGKDVLSIINSYE